MNTLFTFFFTASPDSLEQGPFASVGLSQRKPLASSGVNTSNRFCPHRPHIAALSAVTKNELSCHCGDAYRDAAAFAVLPGTEQLDQVHSFALTASDGARTYGFCRQLHSPSEQKSLVQPKVACILSQHFWPGIFQEVLTVVEALLLTPLESTQAETGPFDWLRPHSPAGQFLEALLETKLPEPGELFSVRRVISKQKESLTVRGQGLSPLPVSDTSSSSIFSSRAASKNDTWHGGLLASEKEGNLEGDEEHSPSAVLDTFDPNNPFDPPSYSTHPSPPEIETSRQNSAFSQTPLETHARESPPSSPSSDSSFSSLQSPTDITDLPFLEERDVSQNEASEASVSGRLEGWELVYSFERPWDVEGDPLADAPVEPLLRLVPPQVLLALLAALLRERRVAVVGPSPSDVSSTVFAAAAILHPFQWQHIFLPTLPEPFLHYLSAPMPFLVGVQTSTWQKLQSADVSLGDIVVLDLDAGSLYSPFPDIKELPKTPASSLESDLKSAYSHLSPDAARAAVLRFFLSLFGWYRRFVRFDRMGHVERSDSPFGGPSATCHLWFDHRTFVGSVRDKKTAAFLNGFQGSQMYEAFVREVLARAAHCRSGEDPFSTEVRRLYDGSQ